MIFSKIPNRRHITLTELCNFYTAPEDKTKVRAEYQQIQFDDNKTSPYLWQFFLPIGSKHKYPFVCSAWIGLTHGISEEHIYPVSHNDDTEDELIMVTFTDQAMIEVTRQDIEQAQSGQEQEALMDMMTYYLDAQRRGCTLFSFGEPELVD